MKLSELFENEMTNAIKKLVIQYGKTPMQINNGLCDAFASDLEEQFPDEAEAITLRGLYKEGSEDEFDMALLKKYWKKTYDKLILLTPEQRTKLAYELPQHDWIVYKDKCYDAANPNGVETFLDLSAYKKGYEQALKASKK